MAWHLFLAPNSLQVITPQPMIAQNYVKND